MSSTENHHETCDLLVVGSGGGALTAAWVAARAGLTVSVVEATDRFGGTTAYSGGGMWLPGNAVLRRNGDDVDVESARAYFRGVVGDRTPADLQDAFLDNGAPLVDHLEEEGPFEFRVLPWPDYYGAVPHASATGRHIIPMPLPAAELGDLRAHLRPPLTTERAGHDLPDELGGGQALIGRFLLALDRHPGVALHLNSSCEELIVQDGRVVGARVVRDGNDVLVHAARGVLIAAGGFENNAELRTRFGVPGHVQDSMGPGGNLGHALLAALDVGADTDLMDQAWWSPGITHPDGSSTFSLWFTGGIFVDDAGKRFTNESMAYDRIGRDIIAAMEQGSLSLPFWMVYDDRAGDLPPARATSVPVKDPESYREAGLWHTADTLPELADVIGVPGEELVGTVERFNSQCEAGVDEDFGRGQEPYDRSFFGGRSPLVPIEQGPFHAVAFGLSDLGTKGGLRTDASARVLDASGDPIPGLYAAGNSQAAVSGYTYPAGGNPIGACMVFGYLAALDVVGQTPDALDTTP